MRAPQARAQVFHDNLAGARARGTAHTGDGHGSPIVDSEAKRYAASLLNDPIYRLKLRRRLRNGEAGALEIWLHRWMLGDPQPAKEATGEADKKRFEDLRASVVAQIRDSLTGGRRPALEEQVLGPLPVRLALPAGDPERDAMDEDERASGGD